jgi:serine protease Do
MRVVPRLRLASGVCVALLVAAHSVTSARADTPDGAVAAVVAKVKPSVVKIISVRQAAMPPPSPGTSVAAAADKPRMVTGSGYIIDASGFVATNRHVIDNSLSVAVITDDGIRYEAKVVAVTAQADTALLKIDATKSFPALRFGDSDRMRVGDTVIAIGSPFGFDDSVTSGIVSAVNRDIMESPFDDYIQTDAPINHGNSGGPLLNLAGEVIGMNSVLFGPGDFSGSIGLGFAIPANELQFIYGRQMKDGAVKAGMLPISAQQIKWMLQQATGAPDLHGALVTAVHGNGDKMMHGQVKPGDIIRALDGETVLDPRDLARKAARIPPGTEVSLEILHDGKMSTAKVPMMAWPEGTPPAARDESPGNLGLELAGAPQGGVMVTSVDPKGSAAGSDIRKGDVIEQVQAQPVHDSDAALKALQTMADGTHTFAAVLVQRDGQRTWIPVALPAASGVAKGDQDKAGGQDKAAGAADR